MNDSRNHQDADQPAPGARVVDAAGRPASVTAIREAQGEPQAMLELDDGTQLLVPVGLLARQPDGGYRLPLDFETSTASDGAQLRVPVVEERLQVGKHWIDTGHGIRLHKRIVEREQEVDQPLLRDELRIERVPVGQVVAGDPPQTRYEGDTLVVPVLEEVLVVQKQLLLKEEVRIHRERREVRAPQTVSLKTEQVTAERFGKDGGHE
jgi:uncharacterized protein (TIGR02271 family)